jgi:hypothetical protein
MAAPDILLMDGGERFGWIILLILYLVFDVLLPLWKKRRQGRPQQPSAPERPAPRPTPPAPRRRQEAPQTPPPAPSHQRRQTARPPRQTPRTAPAPATPHGRLEELAAAAFAPLLRLQGIAPAADTAQLEERLRKAAAGPHFPLNLDHLTAQTCDLLLKAVPGLRAEIVVAARLNAGTQEIRSLHELVEASDRLAVGWLELAFQDAVGLALFGPVYARLRVARLAAAGQTHQLTLEAASSRALALAPPLRIVGPALVDTLTLLNHRSPAERLREELARADALDGPVQLVVTGFGRPVRFDVNPEPAVRVTREMLEGLLRHDFPQLGTELAALSRQAGTPDAALSAARKADAWPRTPVAVADDLVTLLTLAEIGLRHGLDQARTLLRQPAPRPTQGRRWEVGRQSPLEASHSAIAEAIVLGELLARPGRR